MGLRCAPRPTSGRGDGGLEEAAVRPGARRPYGGGRARAGGGPVQLRPPGGRVGRGLGATGVRSTEPELAARRLQRPSGSLGPISLVPVERGGEGMEEQVTERMVIGASPAYTFKVVT